MNRTHRNQLCDIPPGFYGWSGVSFKLYSTFPENKTADFFRGKIRMFYEIKM